MNINKTNYILFCNEKEKQEYEIISNNVKIKKVLSAKFLGVCIDHNVTWKDHMSCVCLKVSKCTAIMNHIRHVVNKDSLTSLIEPHLIYFIEVWGNACESNLASFIY